MLYPLKFKPRFKERIWGGRKLERLLGKKLPEGKNIGESWEISALPGDVSVVAAGALKGNSLQELTEVYMGDLVGEKIFDGYGEEFPLLIKFIDAREELSIQVHPDDELAADRHGCYGKAEMWYVIAAEPGAVVYIGFNRQVTPAEYMEAVEKGTLPSLLHRVEVKAGDSFFLPAGTIHAIGHGVLLAEIQQTSDVTYRVYDWGRVADNGNPRELHRELAIAAIDFCSVNNPRQTMAPVANVPVQLAHCSYFTTNLLWVQGGVRRDHSRNDSFVIYVCVEGAFEVEYSSGSERLSPGETMLIPALEEHIELRGNGTLLEVYIE